MGKRQEAAVLTRQSILDSMRALLEEKDANSINIEDITTKAGIAKGSFYTYFKRKEDVISAVAVEEYDAINKGLIDLSAGVSEKISKYLLGSVKIIEKHTLQIAQNWMKSVAAPLEGECNGIRKFNYDRDNIKTFLKNAVEAGEMFSTSPIEEITECIMNLYYGAVASWCITKGEVSLIKSMEHFCDIALNAMLKEYLVKRED